MFGTAGTGGLQIRSIALVMLACASMVAGPSQAAGADPLIVQGSTTFNRRIMEPYEADIEAISKQDITVIPNRTMLGIIALMEGRAHMAMIFTHQRHFRH